MDQSDDDHSFELVGSEDLHTDKSENTDRYSFDIIGSEELNIIMNMEKLDLPGSISKEHGIDISDSESIDRSQSDEQQLDDMDRNSHKSTESELSFSNGSTYSWDALPNNELGDKWQYKGSRRRNVVYDMDGTPYVFRPNLKLIKDMEIKDVAKDHVIPFLPAKSLKRFRTVSKEWNNRITHPFLAHMQTFCFQDMSGFFCQDFFDHFFVSLNQAAYGIPDSSLSFLSRMVKIRSSSNGLVLCQGVGDQESLNKYYVCNPVNKGFHVLPQSTYYHGPEPNLVLAFEPSPLNCGEDYKVICAFDMYNGPPILCFDIYSSSTRSWTCCNAVCSELGALYLKDNGLYKNGVAYWATSSGELLAFDTVNDICGVQPICSVNDGGILTFIDGELSYVQSYIEPSYLQTDVETGSLGNETEDVKNKCVIEIFGGVDMCLKRHDVFELNMKIYDAWSFRLLFAVKSNLFIFNVDDIFYSWDVKKEKVEEIIRRGINPSATFIPYVNSLVSLL